MAAYAGPWTQRADYLVACDWTIHPGAPTQYAIPHEGQGTDVTSFHPGQWDWSEDNMPEVVYQLDKDASWDAFRRSAKPAQKFDANGQPMWEQYPVPGKAPRPILDFRILPNKIGTEEKPWYLESVRRLDPRIEYEDIIMRMEYVGSRTEYPETKFKNQYLNNPASRSFRPRFHITSWHTKKQNSQADARVRAVLSPAQIAANTTRGTTPGLINPALGEVPGNRIPLPTYASAHGKRLGRRQGNLSNAAPASNIPPAAAAPTSGPSTSTNLASATPSATIPSNAPTQKRKRSQSLNAHTGQDEEDEDAEGVDDSEQEGEDASSMAPPTKKRRQGSQDAQSEHRVVHSIPGQPSHRPESIPEFSDDFLLPRGYQLQALGHGSLDQGTRQSTQQLGSPSLNYPVLQPEYLPGNVYGGGPDIGSRQGSQNFEYGDISPYDPRYQAESELVGSSNLSRHTVPHVYGGSSELPSQPGGPPSSSFQDQPFSLQFPYLASLPYSQAQEPEDEIQERNDGQASVQGRRNLGYLPGPKSRQLRQTTELTGTSSRNLGHNETAANTGVSSRMPSTTSNEQRRATKRSRSEDDDNELTGQIPDLPRPNKFRRVEEGSRSGVAGSRRDESYPSGQHLPGASSLGCRYMDSSTWAPGNNTMDPPQDRSSPLPAGNAGPRRQEMTSKGSVQQQPAHRTLDLSQSGSVQPASNLPAIVDSPAAPSDDNPTHGADSQEPFLPPEILNWNPDVFTDIGISPPTSPIQDSATGGGGFDEIQWLGVLGVVRQEASQDLNIGPPNVTQVSTAEAVDNPTASELPEPSIESNPASEEGIAGGSAEIAKVVDGNEDITSQQQQDEPTDQDISNAQRSDEPLTDEQLFKQYTWDQAALSPEDRHENLLSKILNADWDEIISAREAQQAQELAAMEDEALRTTQKRKRESSDEGDGVEKDAAENIYHSSKRVRTEESPARDAGVVLVLEDDTSSHELQEAELEEGGAAHETVTGSQPLEDMGFGDLPPFTDADMAEFEEMVADKDVDADVRSGDGVFESPHPAGEDGEEYTDEEEPFDGVTEAAVEAYTTQVAEAEAAGQPWHLNDDGKFELGPGLYDHLFERKEEEEEGV